MLSQTQCIILLITFEQFRLLQHKKLWLKVCFILFAPFFVPYVYFGLRKPREIQLCSRLTLHGNPRMSVWRMLITNGTCAISGLSIVQPFQKLNKTSPWNIIALLNILITYVHILLHKCLLKKHTCKTHDKCTCCFSDHKTFVATFGKTHLPRIYPKDSGSSHEKKIGGRNVAWENQFACNHFTLTHFYAA